MIHMVTRLSHEKPFLKLRERTTDWKARRYIVKGGTNIHYFQFYLQSKRHPTISKLDHLQIRIEQTFISLIFIHKAKKG